MLCKNRFPLKVAISQSDGNLIRRQHGLPLSERLQTPLGFFAQQLVTAEPNQVGLFQYRNSPLAGYGFPRKRRRRNQTLEAARGMEGIARLGLGDL